MNKKDDILGARGQSHVPSGSPILSASPYSRPSLLPSAPGPLSLHTLAQMPWALGLVQEQMARGRGGGAAAGMPGDQGVEQLFTQLKYITELVMHRKE